MSKGSETSDLTSKGLGEMFEGDSADMCAGKFPLVSMGARAEGQACADLGARTPIGASGNWSERSVCAALERNFQSKIMTVVLLLVI